MFGGKHIKQILGRITYSFWAQKIIPIQRLMGRKQDCITTSFHTSSALSEKKRNKNKHIYQSTGYKTRSSLVPFILSNPEMTRQNANWSPYDNNGGTVVAIAGSDYCVIASDTRMSTGYSILTRDYSKIYKLADKCYMASSGFQADVKALQKHLAARHLTYQHQHGKQMSCPAMGQLLSNTLYYKRFFPYYAFNVLGGLDSEGKGCVFTYDAVGSYERVGYSAQGSGATLMTPFLDNKLKSPSPLLLPAQDAVTPLSVEEAIDLVKTVFQGATERDIATGDRLEIVVVKADSFHNECLELRKD